MNSRNDSLKILAIQFKSLGDSVLLLPALQALRERYPECQLHLLVPEAAAPLLRDQPFITRIWPMPRVRKKISFKQSWPVISALRAEKFDRSVDFGGNDRGAVMSLLCGARVRLGVRMPGGFFGRQFCYTHHVDPAPHDRHEALRSLHLLSAWNISPPAEFKIQLHPDPTLDPVARTLIPDGAILCYVGAGMPKKQWPIEKWAAFYQQAVREGYQPVLSSGIRAYEQTTFKNLRCLIPEARSLPELNPETLLAVIKRAGAVVSNDTGPMHFAAGLGVPTLALFGPTSPTQWAPVGRNCRVLRNSNCSCARSSHFCQSGNHCMAAISPERVFRQLCELIVPRPARESFAGTSGVHLNHSARSAVNPDATIGFRH
jgi:ADP-heptose:LPS heptosyltransferase